MSKPIPIKNTKKVLHIFGQMERGGAELRTIATMQSLQAKGFQYEFCVLSGKPGVLDNTIREMGGEVHYCKLGLNFPKRFIQLLNDKNVDIVHSHVAMVSGFILFLARLAGIKQRIAHFRNTHDSANSSTIRKLRNRVLHQCINFFATNILGVCKAALSVFWSTNWQQDKRCKTIYNGLPSPAFQTPQKTFWRFLPEHRRNGPVVVNVARMATQKNHCFMVEIIAGYKQQYGNVTLILIGKESADIKQSMLTKAKALGCEDCLFFAGEQDNVYQYLQNADAMLFPSKWEGLPGAVIEAASIGLPVVATDLPGILEIAEYLPAVKPISLEQSVQHWVSELHTVNCQSLNTRQKNAASFDTSPFSLTQCTKALADVYR